MFIQSANVLLHHNNLDGNEFKAVCLLASNSERNFILMKEKYKPTTLQTQHIVNFINIKRLFHVDRTSDIELKLLNDHVIKISLLPYNITGNFAELRSKNLLSDF